MKYDATEMAMRYLTMAEMLDVIEGWGERIANRANLAKWGEDDELALAPHTELPLMVDKLKAAVDKLVEFVEHKSAVAERKHLKPVD